MERLNRLWNLPISNPTQTAHLRFFRGPGGEMRTMFTESREAWEKLGKDAMKTAYDDLWRREATYD